MPPPAGRTSPAIRSRSAAVLGVAPDRSSGDADSGSTADDGPPARAASTATANGPRWAALAPPVGGGVGGVILDLVLPYWGPRRCGWRGRTVAAGPQIRGCG